MGSRLFAQAKEDAGGVSQSGSLSLLGRRLMPLVVANLRHEYRRHYRYETEYKGFELCNGRYRNLVELAQAMEISQDLIYRVKRGDCGIHERFIIGATKAFPGYKLDDLFYADSEKNQNEDKKVCVPI